MKELERMAETKISEDKLSFDFGTLGWITVDGTIQDTTDIFQGFGAKDRVGNEITIMSLQLRYIVGTQADGIGDLIKTIHPQFTLRCIIFTWMSDTVPGLEDILEYTVGISANWSLAVLSPLRFDNRVKRKIWYDKCTQHYAADSVWNQSQYVDIFIPIKYLKKVHYNGDGTAVNKLYIFWVSNYDPSGEGDISGWNVYAIYRLCYKDV